MPPSPGGTAAAGAPTGPRRARAGAKPRRAATPDERRLQEQQRRIKQLRRIEENARRERERLEEKTAAQAPPILALDAFVKRPGFQYATWFKATGTFGPESGLSQYEKLATLLDEVSEYESSDVPSAFYSHSLLGQVRWRRIRSRQSIINELNDVAPWNPNDFRDVYPKWEYRYYIAESVGDVVVRIYEHKARSPRSPKDAADGFEAN